MPLRMLIDSGAVAAEDVALVGARNLDPPEEEFIATSGIHTGAAGIARALDGAACTYVAFDADVVETSELSAFMPEPDGLTVAEIEQLFVEIRGRSSVLGAGLSGLSFEPSNIEPLAKLTAALGL
jgi:arginase family enzyme